MQLLLQPEASLFGVLFLLFCGAMLVAHQLCASFFCFLQLNISISSLCLFGFLYRLIISSAPSETYTEFFLKLLWISVSNCDTTFCYNITVLSGTSNVFWCSPVLSGKKWVFLKFKVDFSFIINSLKQSTLNRHNHVGAVALDFSSCWQSTVRNVSQDLLLKGKNHFKLVWTTSQSTHPQCLIISWMDLTSAAC